MKYPVLVGVGEFDELFSVDATRAFFEEISCKNKEFVVLPGAKHAYFEKTSFDPMYKWINKMFDS